MTLNLGFYLIPSFLPSTMFKFPPCMLFVARSLSVLCAIFCVQTLSAQVYCGFDDGSARYTFENSFDNHVPSETGRNLVNPSAASGLRPTLTAAAGTAPQGNYVATFNGTNQYLDYSASTATGYMKNAQSAITVMMWVKPNNIATTQTLYDWGNATNGLCLRINSAGYIEAGVRKAGVLTTANLNGTLPLTTTDWFLVAMTYSSGNLTLYGRKKGSAASVSASATPTTGTILAVNNAGGIGASLGSADAFGSYGTTEANFFNGKMDEVTVCLNGEMPAGNLFYTTTQIDDYYTCLVGADALACDNKAYIFQALATDLKYLELGTTPVTFNSTNDNINGNLMINAIGYNNVDNYIYGISQVGSGSVVAPTNTNVANCLWRTGTTGRLEFLGSIGLPSPTGGVFDMGACDLFGYLYIIPGGTSSTIIRKINLNVVPYTFTDINLAANPNNNDWVYIPTLNSLAFVTNAAAADKLNFINLSATQPIVTTSKTLKKTDGSTNFTNFDGLEGAAWADGFGNLFFIQMQAKCIKYRAFRQQILSFPFMAMRP
jgi:hypothetical protein